MRTLHLLNWNLQDIIKNLDKIREQGFDSIQITPVQPMKEETTNFWWMPYQPISFNIGNIYGSKYDLFNLCEEAHKRNLKIIVDIVCDHTAGLDNGRIYPHEKVDSKLKNNPYFWKSFDQVYNWNDRNEVIHKSMGLPGLDLSNYDLQDIIIKFLNDLIDIGVDGFRFDAAKSIALPSEGSDFFPRVIYCLKKYGLYLYGEVIFSPELIDKYAEYMKVLTNNEFYDQSKLVKYVESHDSYYDLKWTNNFSSEEISMFYKYLCDRYENTLYFARPYDDAWKSRDVLEGNCKVLHR